MEVRQRDGFHSPQDPNTLVLDSVSSIPRFRLLSAIVLVRFDRFRLLPCHRQKLSPQLLLPRRFRARLQCHRQVARRVRIPAYVAEAYLGRSPHLEGSHSRGSHRDRAEDPGASRLVLLVTERPSPEFPVHAVEPREIAGRQSSDLLLLRVSHALVERS